MIKEANVTVMVCDMETTIGFYTGVLGLKLRVRYGGDFAQVEAPGVVIGLHPAPRDDPKQSVRGGLSIGFAVDNLEKEMDRLKAGGVRFSGVTDDTQVKLAFFTDPDGNPLYLSQSRWQ